MNKIEKGTVLKGEIVELRPLQEEHFEAICLLAKDQRIWQFIPKDMSTKEKVLSTLIDAMEERENGTQFPFVILNRQSQKLIGSTRLMEITPKHHKLEIGWTWLNPDYWATAVNPECKLLLLQYSFEEWKAHRVQLKTDEHNMRSRKAIEKIGAKFEGILRNDMIRDNGTNRNSAYFSIINQEWEVVKKNLEFKLAQFTTIRNNQ